MLEFDALGTHWWIEPLSHSTIPEILRKRIISKVQSFESRYSRFRPTSLVSQLNRKKHIKNPPPELVEMMRFGIEMFDRTDGLFNMSVGGKLVRIGYGKGTGGSISRTLSNDIVVDENTIRIVEDISLDLGGFGKGWLIDSLASLCNASHVPVLINGGGDMYSSHSEPVTCYIEHPRDTSMTIGSVEIVSQGFASSAAQKRVWATGGENHHHIIDPTSGSSKSTLASVHIIADNALIADALGTVFLLTDHEARVKFAAEFNVQFLEVHHDLSYWASSPVFILN
jgi:FAD:protein FMN transferase